VKSGETVTSCVEHCQNKEEIAKKKKGGGGKKRDKEGGSDVLDTGSPLFPPSGRRARIETERRENRIRKLGQHSASSWSTTYLLGPKDGVGGGKGTCSNTRLIFPQGSPRFSKVCQRRKLKYTEGRG